MSCDALDGATALAMARRHKSSAAEALRVSELELSLVHWRKRLHAMEERLRASEAVACAWDVHADELDMPSACSSAASSTIVTPRAALSLGTFHRESPSWPPSTIPPLDPVLHRVPSSVPTIPPPPAAQPLPTNQPSYPPPPPLTRLPSPPRLALPAASESRPAAPHTDYCRPAASHEDYYWPRGSPDASATISRPCTGTAAAFPTAWPPSGWACGATTVQQPSSPPLPHRPSVGIPSVLAMWPPPLGPEPLGAGCTQHRSLQGTLLRRPERGRQDDSGGWQAAVFGAHEGNGGGRAESARGGGGVQGGMVRDGGGPDGFAWEVCLSLPSTSLTPLDSSESCRPVPPSRPARAADGLSAARQEAEKAMSAHQRASEALRLARASCHMASDPGGFGIGSSTPHPSTLDAPTTPRSLPTDAAPPLSPQTQTAASTIVSNGCPTVPASGHQLDTSTSASNAAATGRAATPAAVPATSTFRASDATTEIGLCVPSAGAIAQLAAYASPAKPLPPSSPEPGSSADPSPLPCLTAGDSTETPFAMHRLSLSVRPTPCSAHSTPHLASHQPMPSHPSAHTTYPAGYPAASPPPPPRPPTATSVQPNRVQPPPTPLNI